SDAPFSIVSVPPSLNGIDFTVENVQLPVSAVIDKEVILTFDIINRGNETFFWQKYGQGVQWTVDYLSIGNGYDTVGRIISDGCNTSIELVPGAGCRVSVGYTFKSAGVKTLPITADYAKQVQEINEDNNMAKPAITVSAPNQPSLTVVSPNGGENWQIGSTNIISWKTMGINNTSYAVHIGLWDSAKANQVSVICTSCPTGSDGGTYNWTIPNTISAGTYTIRAFITAFNAVSPTMDFSDTSFSIVTAPTNKMQLLSPNGGETLVKGKQYTISWVGGYAKNVDLNGVSLRLVPEDGIYSGWWFNFGGQPSGSFSWDPSKVMSARGYPYNTDVPDGRYRIEAY
ncbi:MAG: hypothetical protein AAB975_02060, partial [Patescibacteria group bacterium]